MPPGPENRNGSKEAAVAAAGLARRGLGGRGERQTVGFIQPGQGGTGHRGVVDIRQAQPPPEIVTSAVRSVFKPIGETWVENTRNVPDGIRTAVGDWGHVLIAGESDSKAGIALHELVIQDVARQDKPVKTLVLHLSGKQEPPPDGVEEDFSIAEFLIGQAQLQGVDHDARVAAPSESLELPYLKGRPRAQAEVLLSALGFVVETNEVGRYQAARGYLTNVGAIVNDETRDRTLDGDLDNPLVRLHAGINYLVDKTHPDAKKLDPRMQTQLSKIEGDGEGTEQYRRTVLSEIKKFLDDLAISDKAIRTRQRAEAGLHQYDQPGPLGNGHTRGGQRLMADPEGNDPTLRYYQLAYGDVNTSSEANVALAAWTRQLRDARDGTQRVLVINDTERPVDQGLLNALKINCHSEHRQVIEYQTQLPTQRTAPPIHAWSAFVSLNISSDEAGMLSPYFGYKETTEYQSQPAPRIGADALSEASEPQMMRYFTAQGQKGFVTIISRDRFSTFAPPEEPGEGEGTMAKAEYFDQIGWRRPDERQLAMLTAYLGGGPPSLEPPAPEGGTEPDPDQPGPFGPWRGPGQGPQPASPAALPWDDPRNAV